MSDVSQAPSKPFVPMPGASLDPKVEPKVDEKSDGDTLHEINEALQAHVNGAEGAHKTALGALLGRLRDLAEKLGHKTEAAPPAGTKPSA